MVKIIFWSYCCCCCCFCLLLLVVFCCRYIFCSIIKNNLYKVNVIMLSSCFSYFFLFFGVIGRTNKKLKTIKEHRRCWRIEAMVLLVLFVCYELLLLLLKNTNQLYGTADGRLTCNYGKYCLGFFFEVTSLTFSLKW